MSGTNLENLGYIVSIDPSKLKNESHGRGHKYYMFQLSNNEEKFSISYAQLERVPVVRDQRTTYEFKRIRDLQEVVKWNNPDTKSLDVSLLDIKPSALHRYEVTECIPGAARRLRDVDMPDQTRGLTPPSTVPSPAEFFFSGVVSGAGYLGAAITQASQYITSSSNSAPQVDSSTDSGPTFLQIVAIGGAALGAAAAGLYYYSHSRGSESQVAAMPMEAHHMSLDIAENKFGPILKIPKPQDRVKPKKPH